MTSTNQPKAPNILVVDDTPANLLLLARMLTERGCHPRPVLSGRLALEAARTEPPDLILLDITMPEMNGYEVCEQLKADPALKDIPVIFISASNATIDKVKAFKAGGVDYVTKPFQFEEVMARVQTHLHLRWLEKMRDDLTHMVVHDLNNPLAVICWFLDMLESGQTRTPHAITPEIIANVRRCTNDLVTMIASILDVSKMEAGEMKLLCKPCRLDDLVLTVLAMTQPLPGNRSVTFDTREPSPPLTLDVGLIQRVIQNLLSNALKHTPPSGNIRLVITPSQSEVRLAVTDSGPGIAGEHHQRIFEKFGQVEDGKRRRGTGLGLTFCKLAVEAHGGRIGVESEVGTGSTFWLALPRLHESSVAAKERTVSPAEQKQACEALQLCGTPG